MSALSRYAALSEYKTSLNRFTDVALLTAVAPVMETPVSGDMLAVLKHDTRTRVRTRRFIFRALEGATE